MQKMKSKTKPCKDINANTENIAATSGSGAAAQLAFRTWLDKEYSGKISPFSIIKSLDNASEKLIKRKISDVSVWEITLSSVFEEIYNKAIKDKVFCAVLGHKSIKIFNQNSQLYLAFLKHQNLKNPSTLSESNEPIDVIRSRKTIKESIVHVLEENSQGLTAKQILNEIVSLGLYEFGAQNPENVVRVTLDEACQGSGFTRRASKDIFRYERNESGKKVYFLLHGELDTLNICIPTDKSIATKTILGAILWNTEIKQKFLLWMESNNFSTRTAKNYCRALDHVMHQFDALLRNSVAATSSVAEALTAFSELLKSNDEFLLSNSAAHYQFSAALSEFTRFVVSDSPIVMTSNEPVPSCNPRADADFVELEEYLKRADLAGKNLEEIANYGSIFNKKVNSARKYLSGKSWAVAMPGNCYVHRDCIIDLDEAAQSMLKILNIQFAMFNGYSSHSVFYDAVKIELPMFLNDNDLNDSQKIYHIARHLFSIEEYDGNAFIFGNNTHIWKTEPEYSKNNIGVLMSFIKSCGGKATKNECATYMDKIKMSASLNVNGYLQISINKDVLQYCADEYILLDVINLNDSFLAQIRENLALVFKKHPYFIFRTLSQTWYDRLPTLPQGLKWEYLLLQEIIEKYLPEYRTIQALSGQDLDTIKAGVVHKDSLINTFADLVYAYIITENTIKLPKTFAAEELREKLCRFGMIEGGELIFNMHKALDDRRFAWKNNNGTVIILAN